jgi:hypothetical protein
LEWFDDLSIDILHAALFHGTDFLYSKQIAEAQANGT